ncbi:MAG: M60 family metallopeptidase [Planctomycetota bacterium]|nr:M60 family metallopeptidase [Planctomycetota bacterium]
MLSAARVLCAVLAALPGGAGAAQPSGETPALAAHRPTTQEADTAALRKGVRSIAAPGVPGPLVVFGPGAFAVVTGAEGKGVSMPVVVAARAGPGRVVAFGHTGCLDASALGVGDTGTLMRNAIAWAGVPQAAPKVGVILNPPLAEALARLGVDAVALPADWDRGPGALAGVDVLCVPTHALSAAQRDRVRRFIAGGGGVLASGLGWGWLQLNPDKAIREHPGNDLFEHIGIAWGDGTLDRTAPDGFRVDDAPLAPALHALRALDAFEHAASNAPHAPDQAKPDTQAAHALTAAVRVVPPNHAVLARTRRLLEGRTQALVPTQGSPLKASQSLERVLLALQVELEKQSRPEQVRAHPAAAHFPGEVPATTPRVQRTVRISTDVPGWHSTGLYAAPGDVVRVGVSTPAPGVRVRIGCHTDHLWHHDAWRRVPDISRVFALTGPSTRVASAFGGLVYIETPGRGGKTLDIEIVGAVAAPRFVRGQTTPAEWEALRERPGAWDAPWGELESSKVILSVPSAALRAIDDPEALMAFWDAISDAHATLATIPLDPPRPHRFVPDIQISAGYMHSGYPIMTHLDAVDDMTVLATLRAGSWGLLHELGHNHQEGDWTFEGTGEVTCNLFALHAIDTICAPPAASRGHPGVDAPPALAQHLAAGAPFEKWKADPFLALHMYVQLERAFGWDTFKAVFAAYRALPRDERPRSEMDKRDQWMVRFSRACGRNLGPFFQAWGVPTSDAARASIADLPAWMPEGWPGR